MAKVVKINSRASLNRSPKKNWVERKGGLPMYVRRIANHLVQEKGFSISHAIATAINAAKKMSSSGDLNWPGKQNVNPKSRGEATRAVARWNRMKKSASVSKGRGDKMMTDAEFIEHFLSKSREGGGPEISDAEFDELASDLDDNPDDPDTDELEKFELTGEISKLDEDKRLVFGWASIGKLADGTVVDDKQGDVLDDVEEIEKSAYAFVKDSRDGGEMHLRKGVSTLVESFVSTPEKWEALGIPEGVLPVGWWVGFQVADEEVWKAVKGGKYGMFSVHGRGTRKALED